jgi:uncharacterized protein
LKKILFLIILVILAVIFFSLIQTESGYIVKPYQEADSQLLIPQRNVVIATIDLDSSHISFFSNDTIKLLENMNADFIDIIGVTQVDSILTANTVRSDEFEIYVSPIIPEKAERTETFLKELPRVIGEHPELKPYINDSMGSLLFYIYFGYKVSPADIDSSLMEVQTKYSDISFEYTGKSPIVAKTEILLTDDILVFLPVLLILIMAVFLSFKNVKAIVMAWTLIIISVFASYSFVRFMGVQNSPMILLIPIFSLGLLSDYIIHYYYHLFYAPGNKDQFYVRKRLIFPLSLTAISTLTGFLSLLFINGSGHLLLGSIISASVLLTYLGVFLWLPYFEYNLPSRDILPRFQKMQVQFFTYIIKKRILIYILLLAVVGWGLFLLPNLKIEPYPIEQLPEESTIKKSDKIINEDFYGTLPFFIEIDTGGEGVVLNIESLQKLDTIHTIMDTNEVVGYSYSLLTVLKQLSFYFEGDSNLLLKNTGMNSFVAEQYLLYYSSSVDPLEYESLVNASYRVFSIKGLLYYRNVDTLTEFYNLIDRITLLLPEGWSLKVHGMVSELKAEELSLKKNWVFSFVAGSLLIFLVVLIFYKKMNLALLSLIPGFISMIFSFGLISLAGISIDAFSIIFVAIIIGLVIDYSIHTLGAIDSLTDLESVEQGFSYIISYSGKPIFLSFLTSIFSFSVLFLSSFKGARTLGLLLFSSLLVSFFLSVYLLPIIILPYKLKKEKFIKKGVQ